MLVETVRREDLGRPRLSIDRSFIMPGFGTVVTGTLLDGALTVGQEVELLPSGLRRRIRGLQSHQHRIESVGPGNRVAVNLANTTQEEAERGQVLTLPGWLQPTRTADVQLRMVPAAPVPLRHNLGVTFHSGSSETFARVRLLDVAELRPGQDGWAQVHLAEPLPLVKGDYFVLRSSQWTLGGGRIVDPHPARHRRYQLGVLEKLEVMAEGAPEDLVLKALESAEPCGIATLARAANFAVGDTTALAVELAQQGEVVVLGGAPADASAVLMTTTGWARIRGRADAAVQAYHSANPLRTGLGREELRNRLKLPQATFTHVLQRLGDEGVLEETGAAVRAPGHRVTLSEAQEGGGGEVRRGAGARALRAADRAAARRRAARGAGGAWQRCARGGRPRVCGGRVRGDARAHPRAPAGAGGDHGRGRARRVWNVAEVRAAAVGTPRPATHHAPPGRPAGAASRPGALVMQERVYGVDFSGAKDAGKKIWIAQAVPRGQGIMVEACSPSTELLHCSAERGEVLSALRDFIADAGDAAFGCDFPSACPRT